MLDEANDDAQAVKVAGKVQKMRLNPQRVAAESRIVAHVGDAAPLRSVRAKNPHGVNAVRRQRLSFHGTDIHAKAIKTEKKLLSKLKIKLNQYASFLSLLAFDKVGFVAKEMEQYVPKCLGGTLKRKSFLQSLGVDYHSFQMIRKEEAK